MLTSSSDYPAQSFKQVKFSLANLHLPALNFKQGTILDIKIISTAACIALLLTSCALPDMTLEPDFKASASEYKVSGRLGWTSDKPLTFGPYAGSAVKRGWTSTYNIPVLARFQGSKHKVSFDLKNDQGHTASTYAKGRITSRELRFFDGWVTAPLKYDSHFAGIISLGENENYKFMVPMPFETTWSPTDPGSLELPEKQFTIHKINQLEGQMASRFNELSGFEVRLEGMPVAAVQKINADKIWITNTLPEKDRFVLANLCSALILMKDLEEEIFRIENE